MADASRPLSRRERREQEEREAALAQERAAAEAAAPVSLDAPAEPEPEALSRTRARARDERPLSRKERRRLERLEEPMETWTAAEEQAHTGQIPTVTPEVIAEQELAARERAEAAQRDAETASQGIPLVTGPTTLVGEVQEAAETTQEAPGEAESSELDATHGEAAADATEEFDATDEVAMAGVDATGQAEPGVESEPQPQSEQPKPEPEPEPELAAEEPAASEATTDEIQTTPAAGGVPEGLKHLFPAGSLQAKAAAEQAARIAAAQADAASAGQGEGSSAPDEVAAPTQPTESTDLAAPTEPTAPGAAFIGMSGQDAANPGYRDPSMEIPLAATTPVQGVAAPAPDETVADVTAAYPPPEAGPTPSAYLAFGGDASAPAAQPPAPDVPGPPAESASSDESPAPAPSDESPAPAPSAADAPAPQAPAADAPPVFPFGAPAQQADAQQDQAAPAAPVFPFPGPGGDADAAPQAPTQPSFPQFSADEATPKPAPSMDDMLSGAIPEVADVPSFGMTPIEQMASTGQIPVVGDKVASPEAPPAGPPAGEQAAPAAPPALEGDGPQPPAQVPPTSLPVPQAGPAGVPAFPVTTGSMPTVLPGQGRAAARTAVATASIPVGTDMVPSGQQPTTGSIPMATVTTGSIPTVTGAITRPTVELPPAGGLRHFSWVHFAVFGAVAFVLGVVLINVIQATG